MRGHPLPILGGHPLPTSGHPLPMCGHPLDRVRIMDTAFATVANFATIIVVDIVRNFRTVSVVRNVEHDPVFVRCVAARFPIFDSVFEVAGVDQAGDRTLDGGAPAVQLARHLHLRATAPAAPIRVPPEQRKDLQVTPF